MSLIPNTTLTTMLLETREETESYSLPPLPLVGGSVWLPTVVVRGGVVECVVGGLGWVVGGGVCGRVVWIIGGGVFGEEVVESCECVVATMCWVVVGGLVGLVGLLGLVVGCK